MSRIPHLIFILSDNDEQTGGKRPVEIMNEMNNIRFNYAKTIDNDYIIRFTDKNTKRYGDTRYIGSGTFTAVFGIDLIKQPSYSVIPSENLILRVFTEGSDGIYDLIKFTEKYEIEKALFGEFLPEIYLCGRLVSNTGRHIASFLIVKEYFILPDLQEAGIIAKLNFVYNLFRLNVLIERNKYNLCDLKYSNLGFYINDENNFIPVIIDYDIKTLHHIPTLIKERKPITIYNYGSYLTYGLIKIENMNSVSRQSNDLNILDKAHYGGLAQVLFNLFKDDRNTNNRLIENVFEIMNDYTDTYISIIRKINSYKRYYEINKIIFYNEPIPNDTNNLLQKNLFNYFNSLIINLLFSDYQELFSHDRILDDFIRKINSTNTTTRNLIYNPSKSSIDHFLKIYEEHINTILFSRFVLDMKQEVQNNINIAKKLKLEREQKLKQKQDEKLKQEQDEKLKLEREQKLKQEQDEKLKLEREQKLKQLDEKPKSDNEDLASTHHKYLKYKNKYILLKQQFY